MVEIHIISLYINSTTHIHNTYRLLLTLLCTRAFKNVNNI